MDKKF